jgi:hypothetical protein
MLNKNEVKELKDFINRYKEIEDSIDLMQKSIQSLAKKRDGLLLELEDLQDNESLFMNKLIEKYGASEITPYKLLQIYQTK